MVDWILDWNIVKFQNIMTKIDDLIEKENFPYFFLKRYRLHTKHPIFHVWPSFSFATNETKRDYY